MFPRQLTFKLLKNSSQFNYFPTTQRLMGLFHESDDKGGYKDNRKKPSTTQFIREGFKELKSEIKLWTEEVKDRFDYDPLIVFRSGETDVVWDFPDEESLKQWVVTSDSDNNEGYSKCSLTLDQNKNALFSGVLDTRVPKDGRIKRAGYCNIKTVRHRKSFKREAFLDWTAYNMLVMKVRGDGRSYIINIHTRGYYDLMWNDVYSYVLYTRGGPYWQVTRLPFSKFFLSSKGRIQDRQFPLATDKVTNFSISLGDKVNGPFSLEIQYIGVEFDPDHREEFAYELYQADKYIVGV
nr:complex I intermediate-associated protein 30, mitochondrial [Onthophagus taurus]